MAGVGDVDLDGFADVIVGAEFEDPGTSPHHAGRAYVFSGRYGTLLFELISPNEQIDGTFGHTVAGAGDVDQDGNADVIVVAGPNAGRAYVFSGEDGRLIFELVSPKRPAAGTSAPRSLAPAMSTRTARRT